MADGDPTAPEGKSARRVVIKLTPDAESTLQKTAEALEPMLKAYQEATEGPAMRQVQDLVAKLQTHIPNLPDGPPSVAKVPKFVTPLPMGGDFLRNMRRVEEAKWRAEFEREEREKATLATLQAMLADSKETRSELRRLAEKVRAHDEELESYRTGAPGRPGSGHLIQPEFQRRIGAGEIEGTLAEQARVLAGWLRATHPRAHPVKPRTAENLIRAAYNRARKRPEAAPQPKQGRKRTK